MRRRVTESGSERKPQNANYIIANRIYQQLPQNSCSPAGGTRNIGWQSGVRDGDSFLGLLYSKNKGNLNDARFSLPEFDRRVPPASLHEIDRRPC
jgi:hypothetical protein